MPLSSRPEGSLGPRPVGFQYLSRKGQQRVTGEVKEEDLLHTPRPESRPEPRAKDPRFQRTGLGKEYVINPTLPRNPLHVGKPDVPDGKVG